MTTQKKTIVSIGGNAIVRRVGSGSVSEQFENVKPACDFIAGLAKDEGASVIVTHGNGPIVGNIVIRNEAAANILPAMPLYICDADSEGGIGFMIQQSIYNSLRAFHGIKEVAAVVTQTVVAKDDPAFKRPEKPIGPFYGKQDAQRLALERGWVMAEDANRGYRRVVASPRPVRIVEAQAVKKLSEAGVIVIAAGGGGVPVIENADGTLTGIDAVVDKDLATSLLGRETGAETFVNLTQIDMVYSGFGTAGQKGLKELNISTAKRFLEASEFHPGSMRPKIEAAIEFIEGGGSAVFITTPELAKEALKGRAGTIIYK